MPIHSRQRSNKTATPAENEPTNQQTVTHAGKVLLNSFHPLCSTPYGRAAIERYGFRPYIDGSIRREPDLEAEYPSITALCRLWKFAPRLFPGDKAVYLTVKRKYEGHDDKRQMLVAILEVIHRFDNHIQAASWYEKKKLRLPSNCMVLGNPPMQFDQSSQNAPPEYKNSPDEVRHEKWDAAYADRAAQCSVFLVCKPIFVELDDPPVFTSQDMIDIFDHEPGTQNPPQITEAEYMSLKARAGIY